MTALAHRRSPLCPIFRQRAQTPRAPTLFRAKLRAPRCAAIDSGRGAQGELCVLSVELAGAPKGANCWDMFRISPWLRALRVTPNTNPRSPYKDAVEPSLSLSSSSVALCQPQLRSQAFCTLPRVLNNAFLLVIVSARNAPVRTYIVASSPSLIDVMLLSIAIVFQSLNVSLHSHPT